MYYKPDWAEARKRIEAWWSGEVIDRVAIAVTAPRSQPVPERPWPPPADPERLWTDVEYRLDLTEAYCTGTYFGGEAYPRLNPSMGPGTLALFLGAFPTWMDDTVWFDPVFREVSESTTLAYDPRNQWWGVCQQLVAAGVEQGRDRYLVVLPDLIENLDTLASLRGTDALLVDALERPEAVHHVQRELVPIYFEYYNRLFNMTHGQAVGSGFHHHCAWAPGRMAKLQCDIGVMISSRHFEQLAFPYFVQQCNQLDYVLWHLDGRENLRHLDSILKLPNLRAIQWVPGAGDFPEASPEWYPLYRRILSAGKSVELGVSIQHVEPLVRELGPNGLLLHTTAATEEEARDLLRQALSWGAS